MDMEQLEQQLEAARFYNEGYRMLDLLFQQPHPRDPWRIVEEEWAARERMNERARSLFAEIPGLVFTGEPQLKLAAVLLAAIGEFIDSRQPYVDDPWEFAQQVRDRAMAWDERVDELDDLIDGLEDEEED